MKIAMKNIQRLQHKILNRHVSIIVFGIFLAGFVSFWKSQNAFACASCGSSGEEPLVLAPNNSWRFYLGVSRATNFKTVKANGNTGEEASPQFKDAVTLAVGKSISREMFYSLTLPYLQNLRSGKYLRSFGDPIFALRQTVVSQNIANIWQPQVQFILAHKFAHSKPQQEAANDFRLDAFGNGVSETRLGVDVYNGMFPVKAGIAYNVTFPWEARLGETLQKPGLIQKAVATAGYGIQSLGKLMVGVTRVEKANTKINGEVISGSNVIENGFFVSLDAEISSELVLRASAFRNSAFGGNKNGSQSNSFSVAAMWSINE